jgi:hypothetical protein
MTNEVKENVTALNVGQLQGLGYIFKGVADVLVPQDYSVNNLLTAWADVSKGLALMGLHSVLIKSLQDAQKHVDAQHTQDVSGVQTFPA